ncbi:MAG: RNA methyltransferase [Bacteriovoracaceae bacterium]|jgi:hypothetical protein|nr:RNA methyltransferase [Bacteriovoracaceae bacterium]
MSFPSVYLGLLHYPVLGKRSELITTSVTNLDIHDIARSCKTFGVKGYYIVTPIVSQHQLVQKIMDHWNTDQSLDYNPDRSDAFKTVELCFDLESVLKSIEEREGEQCELVVTGANFEKHSGDMTHFVHWARQKSRPLLLLFGTGHGIAPEVLEKACYYLDPINGSTDNDYNHLSVRSAVAIYLDRLNQSL